MSREYAYLAVQRNALRVWDAPASPGGEPVFLTLLKADPEIAAVLNPYALEELFDLAWYTRHVDLIFDRVFAAHEPGGE
jgi:adenylosuccinate lyase